MVLDHSPISKVQAGLGSALDLSPNFPELNRHLKNYLISCKVEGKSPATIATYTQRLTDFYHFIASCETPDGMKQLSSSEVRLYMLSLQERQVSPATVYAYYRSLKTYFNWLINEDVLDTSPMGRIKPPRVPRVLVKPFTEEQLGNLLLLCSGDKFLPVRNRAMVLLFLDTGLRLAEMASVMLQDIDIDHSLIKVMGKGSKERVVAMSLTTEKSMIRYLLLRDDDYPHLWVTEERRPMTRDGVQVTIKKLCRRAQVTGVKIGPHAFRHTFATKCLENGASEFEVQCLLGHSTLDMTRRYTQTLNSERAVLKHKKFSPVGGMKLR